MICTSVHNRRRQAKCLAIVKETILSVDIGTEDEEKMAVRGRNEDDSLVLERQRERERSAKKIVAFNQYLLLVHPCCVSFATTTTDDDFQNNATPCKKFSLSLLIHSFTLPLGRIAIVLGRYCTKHGTISSRNMDVEDTRTSFNNEEIDCDLTSTCVEDKGQKKNEMEIN